jgi:cell fate (sporulation/competence/biofilm development) regulator YmcA (YheA/YmcA/DUF963 family)
MKRVFITDHLAEEDNKSGSMKTIQAAQKSQKRMGRITRHEDTRQSSKKASEVKQRINLICKVTRCQTEQ